MVPMTARYGAWPGPARVMAQAVDAAVSAARAGDAVAFAGALAELERVDPEQLAVVLGSVTRGLLERSHPDGLDSDDAEQVLRSCVKAAAGWYEPLDADVLLTALTGALGIFAPDDSPQPTGPAVVAHGILLIAGLLTALAEDFPPVLEDALGELRRAQTMELP
jgi:hypothetical protein